MEYLEKEDILYINFLTIQHVGGNFVPPCNFLHEENLDYLLEAVQAEMFGQPLYPEIYQKAGLYMYNIICNHIFQDGNKRTRLEAALLFLQLNGYDLVIADDLLTQFTLDVASGNHSLETVQAWFQANSQPLNA
ncbi:type II toxin-antitoxin system death-on-curing family toxin [Spirosoma aerolatum]|uniref:type II toxin-antitoxin system death-on-curing family toxin n=1 Tax=Spirosoma aerolatum TaxID=1211326 RepID=UPI0009ADA8E5|nr:type II toxin-antitoxin system death-on-curing family toxin [Spirosoma aerolatum]